MKRSKVRWYYRRQNLRHPLRWWRERCAGCGRRTYWDESAVAINSEAWHDVCWNRVAWKQAAGERLLVLDVITDVWTVDGPTVGEVMAGQVRGGMGDEANARDISFRVFNDLKNRRTLGRPI